MDKNYGPKGFEKAWVKLLNGFNETKIFFTHNKSETVIKYIHNDKLFGIEMYRCQFEIDQWLNHFQNYLDTGIFDTNAYWVEYTSINKDGEIISTYSTEINTIPMVLKNKIWSVHSPEMNKFMDDERETKGDIGFKQVPRPVTGEELDEGANG